jgi:predicted nucleotidyltransferase
MPHPCVVELRAMLQSVLGDDFVRLYHYGSRVDGGADADSDYDVLCVTKQRLSRDQEQKILDRRMDIELDRDVLFDLHFFSQEDLRTPLIAATPYVDHVLSDGVIV